MADRYTVVLEEGGEEECRGARGRGARPNGRFVRVQFSTHWAETDLKNAAQQLIAVNSY